MSDEERHLSLGVVSFISRALGNIPGPLITGAIFDSACILRNELQEQCGLVGNCLVYDNFALSIRSMVLFLVSIIISTVFSVLAWLTYPKAKPQEEKLEVEEMTVTFE